MNVSPSMLVPEVSAVPVFSAEYINNIAAPKPPIKIPISFLFVMIDPKRTELTIRTKMGVIVMISDALMGLVRESPLKKQSWLIATPLRPLAINLHQSCLSIFSKILRSRLKNPVKAIVNRNMAEPPTTLRTINPEGPTTSGIIPLATT